MKTTSTINKHKETTQAAAATKDREEDNAENTTKKGEKMTKNDEKPTMVSNDKETNPTTLSEAIARRGEEIKRMHEASRKMNMMLGMLREKLIPTTSSTLEAISDDDRMEVETTNTDAKATENQPKEHDEMETEEIQESTKSDNTTHIEATNGNTTMATNVEFVQIEIEADDKRSAYKQIPSIMRNIEKSTRAQFYDDDDKEVTASGFEKFTAKEINERFHIVKRNNYKKNAPKYKFTTTVKMVTDSSLDEIKFKNNKKNDLFQSIQENKVKLTAVSLQTSQPYIRVGGILGINIDYVNKTEMKNHFATKLATEIEDEELRTFNEANQRQRNNRPIIEITRNNLHTVFELKIGKFMIKDNNKKHEAWGIEVISPRHIADQVRQQYMHTFPTIAEYTGKECYFVPSDIVSIMDNGIAALIDNIDTHNEVIKQQTCIHVYNIPEITERVTINNRTTTVSEALLEAVDAIAIYKYDHRKANGHYGIITNTSSANSNNIRKRIETVLTTIYRNETTYKKEWGKPKLARASKESSDAIANYLRRQGKTSNVTRNSTLEKLEDQVTMVQKQIETIQKTVNDLINAITSAQQQSFLPPKTVDRHDDDKPTASEGPTPGTTTTQKQSPTPNIVSPTSNKQRSIKGNMVRTCTERRFGHNVR